MNKNTTITIIAIIVLAVIGFFVYRSNTNSTSSPKVALAQCLADKGATFYGAYWCPHCNNQKLSFGNKAAKKLPYVECALYPTEVAAVAKQVLRDYKAGTYTGGYLDQLKKVESLIEKNKTSKLTDEELASIGGTVPESIDVWEPSQTEVCAKAGISGYPTWKFADGTEKTGEVELPELATKSGCTYDDK